MRDGLDAAAADGGMVGVRPHVRFPVPATFTFLTVSFHNRRAENFAVTSRVHDQLRDIQNLSQHVRVFERGLQQFSGTL